MTYLVDTNVFSALLLDAVPEERLERYEQLRRQMATTSIVVHELRYGAELLPARSKRRAAILAFVEGQVETMAVLPYEARAAAWHAVERARLTKRGETPAFSDSQIAAVAAVNSLTVLTANVQDFRCFHGLRIETW